MTAPSLPISVVSPRTAFRPYAACSACGTGESADGRACLYFADSATFEGVCLTGFARVRTDRTFKELLWNDGDEKYYPSGIDDPDYCVIEFIAEKAEYYRYDGKGALSGADIAAFDANLSYENGYDKEHSH